MITIPPYLKPGDTIGIVCTSGFMSADKAATCINTIQEWGFIVRIGKTIGNQYHYFSGTDDERLEDLQLMLDDVDVKAILFGRGGYGLSRIIDLINFNKFVQHPKWLIGFSDITLLHSHVNNQLKIATLHAPMAAAFNDEGYKNEFVQSIRNVIEGKRRSYTCDTHELNRNGIAAGELIGGNLSMVAHAIGTKSGYKATERKILFLEDVGEYLYSIERLLIQLKRSGLLDNLAGVVIGGFTELKDTIIPFGATIYEIINSVFANYNYPLCFNFPVGHQANNYALKVGGYYQLEVTADTVTLEEVIN